MKRFINTIVKKVVNENHKPLGRWNIDYCSEVINKKIDLSNEDNCGPCGQYMSDKIYNSQTNKIIVETQSCAIHDDWMAAWVEVDYKIKN